MAKKGDTKAKKAAENPAGKPRFKKVTETAEFRRLMKIFKHLPPAKLAVAQGLIRQAARQRERLDNLWEDLQTNGEVEMFSQSENSKPYARERPAAKNFRDTDKAYQSIIKQLCDLAPDVEMPDALDAFR